MNTTAIIEQAGLKAAQLMLSGMVGSPMALAVKHLKTIHGGEMIKNSVGNTRISGAYHII